MVTPVNGFVIPAMIAGPPLPALANVPTRGEIQPIQIVGGVPAPLGYIYNAVSVWLDHENMQVGIAGTQSHLKAAGGAGDIIWTGAIPINILTTGPGGVDVGAAADNLWYAVYVIGDSTNANAPNAVLSLNFVSPTLPAGYDLYRRVHAVYTSPRVPFPGPASLGIRGFVQYGLTNERIVMWMVPSLLEDGVTPNIELYVGIGAPPSPWDATHVIPPVGLRAIAALAATTAAAIQQDINGYKGVFGQFTAGTTLPGPTPNGIGTTMIFCTAGQQIHVVTAGGINFEVYGYYDEL